MDILLEKLVLAVLIAIHTYIVMYNSLEHVNQRHSQEISAIPQICVIWEEDADSTLVRLPVVNALNISLCRQVHVSIKTFYLL